MKSPIPRNHIACQSIHRFVIEALGFRTETLCTCLAESRDMLCQRYPDRAPQILVFYAQAIEFRQTLLDSSRRSESLDEEVRWFDAEENSRPDGTQHSQLFSLPTPVAEEAGEHDSILASAVQGMELRNEAHVRWGEGLDLAPCLETNSEVDISSSKSSNTIDDEDQNVRFRETMTLSSATTRRIVSPQTSVCTDIHSVGEADQGFRRETGPQHDATYYRKLNVQAIERSLDTEDDRSPTIDFELSFPEIQSQQRTVSFAEAARTVMHREWGSEKRSDDDEKLGVQEEMQEQGIRNSMESYARGKKENDKGRAEDETDGEEAGNNDEDDDETFSASPDRVREKELIEPATVRLAGSIELGERSSNHQSNKRPVECTVNAGPSSKRTKATTHVDNGSLTAGATTTSAENHVDQSFWDEWDMKRAAMTNHDQQTDQSVKAARVWRRLSAKQSLGLSRSRRGQNTSLRYVDKLVTMVIAVANCYAFGALKEVICLLQQDRTARTSELFSNDPKVLMETVSTIEKASHLHSYIRRFTLARLANIYVRSVANGGRLTLDENKAYSSQRLAGTNARKAATYSAMILHIWGVPFPAQNKGAKMTKRGFIDAFAADAMRWNKCKARLRHEIDAGQRWLGMATRFGWSTLGLITREWSVGDKKVVASDRM
ncbi:hypothetical protein LTR84_001264 [Exophiala bonariae]|uniref:Uncharacterized protein n=1 Tax=Exophiala bonariae TaxID=1690606 RepID=A0AAV9NTA4_9EURO|nr:hypothetical protein LTR84_001264 [Exophiala bonariae]